MSQQSFDAIFENGAFRPLNPPQVPVGEGERVQLHIEPSEGRTSLDLAYQVYDGLSEDEITELERVAFDRSTFFGPRNET